MKIYLTLLSTIITSICALADSQKFAQDRAAILAMSGAFEVEFNFEETVSLDEGYKLKKPYLADAYELVEVAQDTGKSITLQHLLVVEGEDGPVVIKHWGQVWKYEDRRTLNYEGGNTWLPVTHSDADVEGTWTQFVTQIDESPRYKAFGAWVHTANTSIWTSRLSTRPLPRREYTKRNDYDLLMVTNRHVITPEGWVHRQDNSKLVSREGKRKFLCMERGLNQYRWVLDENSKGGLENLSPELRIYNQPNIVTSEADIKINIFYDKFMTMNYVQNQDYFNIRYQFKPFMFWIWVSTLMLSLSGLFSFARGKYEK
mgnify:CR=1 FL=1